MHDRPPAPDAQLRLLLQRHGICGATLRPARGGLEHHLFHVHLPGGSAWFGKVPRAGYRDPHWPDRDPRQALLVEDAALSHIASRCGAVGWIPRPYRFLDGDPPGALLGVVPGSPPEHTLLRRGMDLRLVASICTEMGAMLAEIHRVRRPTDPGRIPDLPGGPWPDPRLLHMDYHLGNVLGSFRLGFGWKLSGVVDWTCAHWGPREADVGELGASLFATNPAFLDDFLAGYRSRTGVGLNRSLVFDFLVAELERRLRDDSPDEPTIRNLWLARIDEWSRAG
ncbi:MAG: aminoglycoside phosphotransferase family protein [Deltaproteobacteria bacterium]|nr:MAG: aminoglycoside phosphotransferase family protein [Deltaproteobacteria bacterium]